MEELLARFARPCVSMVAGSEEERRKVCEPIPLNRLPFPARCVADAAEAVELATTTCAARGCEIGVGDGAWGGVLCLVRIVVDGAAVFS